MPQWASYSQASLSRHQACDLAGGDRVTASKGREGAADEASCPDALLKDQVLLSAGVLVQGSGHAAVAPLSDSLLSIFQLSHVKVLAFRKQLLPSLLWGLSLFVSVHYGSQFFKISMFDL